MFLPFLMTLFHLPVSAKSPVCDTSKTFKKLNDTLRVRTIDLLTEHDRKIKKNSDIYSPYE